MELHKSLKIIFLYKRVEMKEKHFKQPTRILHMQPKIIKKQQEIKGSSMHSVWYNSIKPSNKTLFFALHLYSYKHNSSNTGFILCSHTHIHHTLLNTEMSVFVYLLFCVTLWKGKRKRKRESEREKQQ